MSVGERESGCGRERELVCGRKSVGERELVLER